MEEIFDRKIQTKAMVDDMFATIQNPHKFNQKEVEHFCKSYLELSNRIKEDFEEIYLYMQENME